MNNKKILLPLLTAALLASCGRPTTDQSSTPGETPSSSQTVELQEYDMSGVSFADATFPYDGTAKSIEITGTLPTGVTVSYEGNGNVDAGTYTVTAKFKGDDKHKPIADMTAKMTITKGIHDVSALKFEDASFVYDGTPKSLEITGELPNGVTVSYEGNGQTNVGTYTVTAKFGVDKNHEPIPNMTATLTITKATVDMSGVTFADETFVYDGTAKSIEVKGELPAGVTVTYEGNEQTEVGTYTVKAKFAVDGNHEPIADMSATLAITKATFVPQFNDLEVYYDGQPKSIQVENELPTGINVTYEGNEQTNPGEYTVTAKFTVNGNYEPIADMTAKLKILYIPYALVREDWGPKGVSLERLADGTMIYSNGTSGVLEGDNQNWGESGLFFYEIQDNRYQTFASLGYRYIKMDVNFGDAVESFNLRYGPGLDEYYAMGVAFDTPLTYGRELNFFDMNGKRVHQITRNTWYTMYINVTGPNFNSFWTNGGSLNHPAVTKIRNVEATKTINPSVAPYFKESKGTVSVATEVGVEGAFKMTKNDPSGVICFNGITHVASPGENEYAGGFFDDDANRYFIFDYFISETNQAFNLECGGQGFEGRPNFYCNKQTTAQGVKIYQNGAEVATLQDGWNTVQIEIPHTAGGWTDFLFSIDKTEAFLRDAYYSVNPLK